MLVSVSALWHKDIACMYIQVHHTVLMRMVYSFNHLDNAGQDFVGYLKAILAAHVEGSVKHHILQ